MNQMAGDRQAPLSSKADIPSWSDLRQVAFPRTGTFEDLALQKGDILVSGSGTIRILDHARPNRNSLMFRRLAKNEEMDRLEFTNDEVSLTNSVENVSLILRAGKDFAKVFEGNAHRTFAIAETLMAEEGKLLGRADDFGITLGRNRKYTSYFAGVSYPRLATVESERPRVSGDDVVQLDLDYGESLRPKCIRKMHHVYRGLDSETIDAVYYGAQVYNVIGQVEIQKRLAGINPLP